MTTRHENGLYLNKQCSDKGHVLSEIAGTANLPALKIIASNKSP
jgi:hypothetical protein